ncbi:MAG: hypothetical protein ABIQ01_00305 [Pseudolysinimonas sp.]
MTTAPVSSGPSKLLIALIAIGGVLLLTITAVVFLLVGQNSGGTGSINAGEQTPITDSSTGPTPAADPADGTGGDVADGQTGGGSTGGQSSGGGQAPVDNSLRFTSFNYNAQVACDPTGNDEKPSPSISWSSANAAHVYWSPSDDEATAEDYEVGASGNQDDMSYSKGEGERYEFPCNHRETFDTTITLVGANGQTVSKTVTFTDINWNSGGDDDDY